MTSPRSLRWLPGPARPIALAALSLSAIAFGYVLPGGAILRYLVAERDGLHLSTLKVEGAVSFYGPALQEAGAALQLPVDKPEAQADGAFSLRMPGRCRLDVSTPEGTRLAVVSVNGRSRNEGGAVQALDVMVDQVCRLLALRTGAEMATRAELDRYLRQLGVDTVESSLDRQGDQVVYVLGKAAPNAAQVWVFKDSFLPARLKLFDAARVPWEVRFVDYNSPSAGESFPRIVDIYRQGEQLVRFTTLKADSRANVPDRLFAAAP